MQENWSDVWKLGLSVFAHQRIEVQILLGLLAAFLAIMVLEGLRASFFIRRRGAAIPPEPEERIVFVAQAPPQAITAEAPPAQIAPVQTFGARRMAAPASVKRKMTSVRRHKTTRPIIRRMANVEELSHDQEMTA